MGPGGRSPPRAEAARRGAPGHPASVRSVRTCLHPVSLVLGTVLPAWQVAERGRYREGKRQLLRALASPSSCPLRPGTPSTQEKASCFLSRPAEQTQEDGRCQGRLAKQGSARPPPASCLASASPTRGPVHFLAWPCSYCPGRQVGGGQVGTRTGAPLPAGSGSSGTAHCCILLIVRS